jgi:glycosyltransferase involved in cell wall biosynthesis
MTSIPIYCYSHDPLEPSWQELLACIGAVNEAVAVLPRRISSKEKRDINRLSGRLKTVGFGRLCKTLDRRGQHSIVLTRGLESEETYEISLLKKRMHFKQICLSNPKIPFLYRMNREASFWRRHSFQKIDRFLASSTHSKSVLEREYILASLISIWEPGFNFHTADSARRPLELKKRFGFGEADVTIGFFGPYERDETTLSVLETFRLLLDEFPRLRFCFAGWGRCGSDYRDWFALLGLRNREQAAFCPIEKYNENDIYALSDILILSKRSVEDSVFGIHPRLVRALATAKPIFLPDLDWIEAAAPKGAQTYPENRFDRAADVLRILLRHPHHGQSERTALAKQILKRHSIEKQSRAFADLCDGVLKQFRMERSYEKKVTVLIPCYNRANVVSRAIKSVLNQRKTDLSEVEILCIDDGSEDGTVEMVAKYPGVRILRLVHTGKVSKVRNAGLKQAKGEIIAYLDSDDRWESDHLRRILKAFRHDQDLGMVITGFKFERLVISEDGQIETIPQRPFHGQRAIITDAVAHKKSCTDAIGDFPDFLFAEDRFYWKRMMDLFPYMRLRAKTAVYSFTEKGNNLSYAHSTVLKDKYY